jgi:hypothetical protein
VTLFQALGIFASGGAGAAAAPGMVLMNPTSIAYSGTSATLGANGQVTFSAVTSLSLNGCFTADFDNYVISLRYVLSSLDYEIMYYMRASGTDATGADYTSQRIFADGSSVSANRTSTGRFGYVSATQRSGDTIYLYGPFLAQPTATRSINVAGRSSAAIADLATTHSLSTSYDGITLYPAAGNFSGALTVMGVRY